MQVTGKELVTPKITKQYPENRETLDIPERFSVPRNIVAKAGLDKVRVYFSASNLLTWKSNDLLVDPEMPVNGLCSLQTPSLRTFTFGIDLGF